MRTKQVAPTRRRGKASVHAFWQQWVWSAVGAAAFASGAVLPAQAAADFRVAQAGSDAQEYNIAAGPLPKALNYFAEISGLELVYPASLATGLDTAGITGRYSVREALAKLLEGTGLTYRFTKDKSVTLEKAPAANGALLLNTLGVEGAAQESGALGANGSTDATATEGTKSYTPKAVTIGSKTPQSLKDTPQSVTVVTRQRIEDQNLTDLAAAMNLVPGISTGMNDSVTTNYTSRGFTLNTFQIDGGAPLSMGNSAYYGSPNLAEYDHLEILRGADGLFMGAGYPGGVVSLERKRPLDHFQFVADGSYGSWDNRRAELDATGPLIGDGKIRGRVVAEVQDKDFFYDIASSKRNFLYGIVETDLGSQTQVRLGASHEGRDEVPNFYGLPRYGDGSDLRLPRSTALMPDWNRWNIETSEFFAELDHKFNDDWKLQINALRLAQTDDYKFGYVYGTVNPVTLAGPTLRTSAQGYNAHQNGLDVAVSGSLELFGRRQEIVLGGNLQDLRSDYAGGSATSTPAVNVFDFNPASYGEPATPAPSFRIPDYMQKQEGIYGNLRLHVLDSLTLLVGERLSYYKYGYTYQILNQGTGALTSSSRTSYQDDNVSTPGGALIYALTPSYSMYASYAQIYQSQASNLTSSGKPLDPITGVNYEAGVKGAWRDGALNASLAVYKIDRKNAAIQDPSVSLSSGPNGSLCCYIGGGDIESKGVDLELSGEVLPGLQVATGYTYNENDYKSGYKAQDGTAYTPATPKNLLKLWGNYRLPGNFQSWAVGAGLNAQTAYYSTTTTSVYDSTGAVIGSKPGRLTQGSYAIANVRVGYQINKNWQVALLVNNLLDRTYYQSISYLQYLNWYGDPRNVMFTLHAAF